MIAGLVIFIISLIVLLCSLGYLVYRSVNIVKIPHNNVDYKTEMKWLFSLDFVFALSFMILSISIFYWKGLSPTPLEMFQAVFGGFFVALSFGLFLLSFIVHYYRKKIPEKLNKFLYISLLCSILVCVITFFVWTNGYADHIPYPLPNGFWFTNGLTYPGPNEGSHIAFYAIIILSGALFVYFLCDHRYYQQYGKHGILESLFLVAFPAGIIGARIGYCIGNWEKDFAGKEWWKVFDLRTGGLTIIAGALVGIIVGVLWFKWRRKQYSIWVAVDIIVPTILLAQAIGRWGNFFNVEVHGFPVDEASFSWLPKVIFNNMHYSSAHSYGGVLEPLVVQVYVPLFLIESITNVLGYVILAYVFGKKFRKYTELGDLAFGYIIWYGLTRVIMEPLRDGAFNMGNDGYWSWLWSLIFVLGGALLIYINHVVRYLIRYKKGTQSHRKSYVLSSLVGLCCVFVFGLTFIIVGSCMIASSDVTMSLAFTEYTKGLIFLFIGIATFAGISIPFTYLIGEIKFQEKTNNEQI